MKRLRVCKPALGAATAFLMISSVISMAASASGTNEIKLRADKTSANAGDTINVTASIAPDKLGVAGFTFDIHFDPNDVEVYIPTDEELNGKYSLSSDYSVITNYSASDSSVKVVGANLKGANVTAESDVALATFVVKDTNDGKADFWIEVDTLIKESGEDYVSASYSAPTKAKPMGVNIVSAEQTKAPETTTTTEASTKAVTTKAVTKATVATTSAATTTTTAQTTTTAPSETETTTSAQTEPEVTEAPMVTTVPEVTSAAVQTTVITEITTKKNYVVTAAPAEEAALSDKKNYVVEKTDETAVAAESGASEQSAETEPVNMNDKAKALFDYVAGATGFNSEEAVQYSFRLSDYIDDYSRNYDIKVNIETTGTVGGAVGAMRDGEWTSELAKTYGDTSDSWTYENVDPNNTSDQIYVQLYSLSANAEFEIESIDIISVGTHESAAHITADDTQPQSETKTVDITEAVGETEAVDNGSATVPVENKESANTLTDDTQTQPETESESAQPVISNPQSIAETEAKVAEMESSAAEKDAAPASDSKINPSTGFTAARKVLTVAALGEIFFSLFVVFYNRYIYKDDEE